MHMLPEYMPWQHDGSSMISQANVATGCRDDRAYGAGGGAGSYSSSDPVHDDSGFSLFHHAIMPQEALRRGMFFDVPRGFRLGFVCFHCFFEAFCFSCVPFFSCRADLLAGFLLGVTIWPDQKASFQFSFFLLPAVRVG